MTIFYMSLAVAVTGLLLFLTGLKQHRRWDLSKTPLISPIGKQFFGGAMVVAGVVMLALLAMKR
jgi:hypothetical protein